MTDVRLDFSSFVRRQAAAPDRQRQQIVVCYQMAGAAIEFAELHLPDRFEMAELPLSENVGVVGERNRREIVVESRQIALQIPV